ncbi:MAG: DUF4175 family protein [Vicinamibacterales bacterium]
MTQGPSPYRERLLEIIRSVRGRWRRKIVLRSLTVLIGAAILTLMAASFGLEQFRFSAGAIVAFRVVTYVALVALGWFAFVRPSARRVSDMQVALYLEEHEPSLDETLLSAVDASDAGRGAPHRRGESEALLRRLVETAVEKCGEIDYGRGVERRDVRQSALVLAGIAVVATGVFVAGPAWLRQGAIALLLPAGGVEAASPYRIDVTPGNATVSRGADVSIAAALSGFESAEADLYTRRSPGAPFERSPMVMRSEGGGFDAMLFGLREATEYFVQSAGVRSATFEIDVADLPYVEQLELEYVFPAYTGLPPQKIERGGDVAALAGTIVKLRVHSTLATGSGRAVLDDRDESPLTPAADGTLAGSFEVKKDGFYRIDLQAPTGAMVAASPQYTIDVLEDQPPVVSFARPARDLRPTSLEEVFVEATAEDDFGVKRLDLLVSVNGGAEKTVPLVGGGARPLAQLSAGHTFFLEEMNLQPGDVVSYYARATDNDTVGGAKTATSDMFFLQVRPFRKDYRVAESQAGAQAGGQGSGGAGVNDPSAFSEQQRRIVSGTFNVVRDRPKTTAEKFREDVVFLTLAQGQLRERVEALSAQIESRVGSSDESMKVIAGSLDEAAKAMQAAEGKLQGRDPKGALPPEQQALASLQRAEEAYRDVRVMLSRERGGGGGAGGQSSAAAEELADLFQLEMDRLRNQYETFDRAQQQSANNQVDEMLERLRELARRQEQEAERQRQLAGSRQAGGAAASARQRQLADETEEAARRLERLSREENRPDLAEAARRMQEAADAMRRAAASGDASAFADASAAAERLNNARDRLEQQRSDRMLRDIEAARDRVRRLAEQQKEIREDVASLGPPGPGRRARSDELTERKNQQVSEVADIERQLDRTASEFRRERQQAAREVQEAADGIRDDKLKEKIQYSRGLIRGAPAGDAAEFEGQIGADIESLDQRLQEAARAAGRPERDTRAEALERARRLVRAMESQNQRLQAQQGQQGEGEQGQGQQGERAQGRQGQQGERQQGQQEQQGQRGQGGGRQQGETGARGQAGQQGQGQRGQVGQQGEAGQRGQGGSQGQQGEQGREGSQGQGREGGQGRGQRGDDRASTGSFEPGGGGGARRPGEFGPEDARQFRREARERRDEAQALRRDLQALGVDVTDLDRLIRDLRALDSDRLVSDPEEVARLQSQLVEGFRRFEFHLRRTLGDVGADELLLSGSDEAPAEYRKLIEEYYRSLARAKGKK